MATDRMQQIKELVKAGQIDEARELLETMDTPQARKWLRQLNERYPPPNQERLWQSDSQDKRLIQARQLLRDKRYMEARWILQEIQHMPQARQWLLELDELEGNAKRAEKAAPILEKFDPDSPTQKVGDFVRSANFRIGVGSAMILFSIVIFVMWVALPWIDGGGSFEFFGAGSEATCTAAELNAGRFKCQQMGYVEPEVFFRGNTGFVSVRIVDRFLVALPVLAIIAAVVGWSYTARRTDEFTAFAVLTFAAVMFAAIPFIWESLSGSEAENLWINSGALGGAILGQQFAEYLSTTYATTPFKVVGIFAALFMITASGLQAAEVMGMLGLKRATPLESPDGVADQFQAGVFEKARQARNRERQ